MSNPSELREALLTIVQDGEHFTEDTVDKTLDAVIANLLPIKEGTYDEFEQGWNSYRENTIDRLREAKNGSN